MSVRELDLPAAWTPPSRFRDIGLALLMLVVGLIMITTSVPRLRDNTWLATSVILLGVGISGFFVLIVRGRVRRTAVRGVDLAADDDGSPVLRVRQPRALQLVAGAWLLSLGGGGLMLGAAHLAAGAVTGVLFLCSGALVAGLPLVVLLRGAPLPEIRLGPEAVHVRGGGRSLAASWDDIEAVVAVKTGTVLLRARDVRRRAERFSWTAAGRRRRDATGIEFPAGQYAVRPALLFHLLRFYHQNPLARTELGTAASLQRARAARFSAP